MAEEIEGVKPAALGIVPSGRLVQLRMDQIKPSRNNPRRLFDRQPLDDLKEDIRRHGVLVPITVYPLKGQDKYAILDGERRHKCCTELEEEGLALKIPANVVDPPNKMAGLLYMFAIHNFREAWELMPTALALKVVMDELGSTDTAKLNMLTGLSEPQIERCKILLAFPERYQKLSLDDEPTTRIPSNFWIEVHPLLDVVERDLPKFYDEHKRGGIIDLLVSKYRKRKIKSVIHFRRVMEAYEISSGDTELRSKVLKRLKEYILDEDLETRRAFDEFITDNRRTQDAVEACDEFVKKIRRAKIENAVDRDELVSALEKVRDFAQKMIERLEGSDPPTEERERS